MQCGRGKFTHGSGILKKLDGKVAIVTGGGQGVGRGVALALAKEGARVCVSGRTPATLRAVAGEIQKLGHQAIAVVCDVSKEDQVKNMVAEVVKQFGPIDILVNNAQTIVRSMPLEEGDDAWWDASFDSGPKGTWYCCKAVFPYMKDRGGRVINLASRAGLTGRHSVSYAGAKEAIRGFTRRAASEWGKYGITVNVICPKVQSPAQIAWQEEHPEELKQELKERPISRHGDAEGDVGRTAVFLASNDAGFITGQTIMVVGGEYML